MEVETGSFNSRRGGIMSDPGGDSSWVSTVYSAAVSLGAVALGTLIRYSHAARRHGTDIPWARLKYEGFAVVGLSIIAGPVSEYVHSTFGVTQGVTATTCIILGYLGPAVFDKFGNILEKKDGKDGKDD
jgi:hypothetical protein